MTQFARKGLIDNWKEYAFKSSLDFDLEEIIIEKRRLPPQADKKACDYQKIKYKDLTKTYYTRRNKNEQT